MIAPFRPYRAEQPWLPFSEVLLDWDEDFHQLMLCDHVRMVAYESAIRAQVKPGDVVVDLGTGTGILALWALEAGAATVYGIDLDARVLDLATQHLRARGFGERFVPINSISYDVALPQRADVLISEIMGNVGDNEDFQPILADALERLLKPGGLAIPSSVETYVVPVDAARAHRSIRDGEIATLSARYDLARLLADKRIRSPFNLYYDTIVPADRHLSTERRVQDYGGTWRQPSEYARALEFGVDRPGELTGFKGFFRARLSPQIVLDISSGDIDGRKSSDSWKHCFFPIERPIAVGPGDTIQLRFERHYPEGQAPFRQFYSWQGHVTGPDRGGRAFGQSMDETRLGPASH